MSHLVTAETVRIELPPDDDGTAAWVEIKRRLSLGDFEALGMAMEREGLAVGSAGSLSRLLERAIVSWSFDAEVSRESIACFSIETATLLATEVNRLNPTRTGEERAPLSPLSPSASGSNRKSRRHPAK
jgi:hypothetical protein